jgi:outer membrane protein assembly factor BamB
LLCLLFGLLPPAWPGHGSDDPGPDDWPMSRHDAQRSAASPRELPARMRLLWTRDYPPLEPAWPDQPKLQFDAVYDPIVLDRALFVASPKTDTVTALDTETGAEKWQFHADGPIRFAPAGWEGKLFVASDDGYLYCLDAGCGTLLWKFRGGPSDRKILGNERLISTWPARGGPVVADGTVYFAAGIWPFMGIVIDALDAHAG